MRIEVLNTGTELMLGGVVNTNLAMMARELFPLGLRLQRQTTVPDGDAIRDALRETFGRADVLLVTGGLGPTTDDLTRDITADLLGLKLEYDEEIMRHIRERFARRGLKMTDRVGLQALRPKEATVLINPHGTAPGLYFPANGGGVPHIFLLPGPPRELQPMMRDQVVPMLAAMRPEMSAFAMRTYRVLGLGESIVEDRVGASLLAMGLEVGYCARPGEVDLRLIGAPDLLTRAEMVVRERLGAHIFTSDSRSLEQVVIDTLAIRKETLAVAESCTGGFIAHQLTNVPGASRVFLAGYVTYANEAKTSALGVDATLIANHGAVSEPVARAMAEGALRAAGAHFAVATTGIAGPDGGSAEKPVGTVYVALAERGAPTIAQRHRYPTDRETFKHLTAQTALDLLLRRVDGREEQAKTPVPENTCGASA
jgi:nicotinamide-nucleotide amidase